MKPLITAAAMVLAIVEPSGAAELDIQITRAGARAINVAPAQSFTGVVKVEMLYSAVGPERTSIGTVSFSPGARTAWHRHPLGQTLVVTAGVGRIQHWGSTVEEIRVGDVVHIPPNTKHWHGAAPNNAMTHIAITEMLDGTAAEWMEQVVDEQYLAIPAAVSGVVSSLTSQGQQLFGDVAPKFAQLTDDVLFGDIWARPGLSKRDRSLITVSALIAMNRPEQMRGHLARARQNGISEAELIEVITHLAFYAGWPSAVTAIGVAREVFAGEKP
ncbi:carboxymuconolactone decarboxylase [Burkholderia diffusa]|uniref:Carboxymuconolactone decarboxylase n=1 Tax=Burkholderia diffusa TaxID=488732 RepID=A0AAW3P9P0_9BURK|nr:carboxymuconolactone decarboxylase family protein [Burkholderia diffusa]KWF32750.1 carboxymuconolactone decarboxylase [Burkholderia diffusa]KWF38675.1 carboxymuconolactone decarboxylase [Burkholderia diffusa]KWF46720.1 carboxymuconolactone decarboxylase [Burkholderia diffusa]KWF50708.1 carboxymuconolactone decarboxylase [Burkholderia diffusa]